MAKEKKGNGAPDIVRPPEGFQSVTAERGVPWLVKDEKQCPMVIMGRLVGRFPRKGGRRGYFYQVKLAQACEPLPAVTGSKRQGNQEAVQVGPGKIIAFDEFKALEDLAPYADSDGTFDVWICLKEKLVLPNDQTFWDTDIQIRQVKAPSTPIVRNAAPDLDDLPF